MAALSKLRLPSATAVRAFSSTTPRTLDDLIQRLRSEIFDLEQKQTLASNLFPIATLSTVAAQHLTGYPFTSTAVGTGVMWFLTEIASDLEERVSDHKKKLERITRFPSEPRA